jgi:hypothetical protein
MLAREGLEPPEIIDYVDSARNPDIYTREFVELVQRGNQDLRGPDYHAAQARRTLACRCPGCARSRRSQLSLAGAGPSKNLTLALSTLSTHTQLPPTQENQPDANTDPSNPSSCVGGSWVCVDRVDRARVRFLLGCISFDDA